MRAQGKALGAVSIASCAHTTFLIKPTTPSTQIIMARIHLIPGKKFGRLTPLRIVSMQGREPVWECLCDCGQTKNVATHYLLNGDTKSCGCLRRELAAKKNKGKFGPAHPSYRREFVVEGHAN